MSTKLDNLKEKVLPFSEFQRIEELKRAVKVGTRIVHKLGGEATVTRVQDGRVHFENGGFSGCHWIGDVREVITT